jgi:excisionase family DNA binding protein
VTAGTGAERRDIAVPLPAFRLLVELLTQLADGNAVTVIPVQKELTTQKAAELLGVSRPYLVRLLEEDKIPFRRVGSRRRVLLADLMAFKHREATHRRRILDQLTADAEDLGLGY